jgi:hypothetical protein
MLHGGLTTEAQYEPEERYELFYAWATLIAIGYGKIKLKKECKSV